MASLKIPARYVAGMSKIISLPDEPFEELVSVLSGLSPSIDVRALASEAATGTKMVSREDVSRIVRTVFSLYVARSYSDDPQESVDEFVDDIWQGLRQSDREELQVSAEDKDRVERRLRRLLTFDTFNAASKAMNLLQEHERLFCDARILTDARPIYGSDPKATPKAAVITHTLRVAYHEGGEEIKEIYIVIDAADIKELRNQLDRAESKSASLRALFGSMNVPVFS